MTEFSSCFLFLPCIKTIRYIYGGLLLPLLVPLLLPLLPLLRPLLPPQVLVSNRVWHAGIAGPSRRMQLLDVMGSSMGLHIFKGVTEVLELVKCTLPLNVPHVAVKTKNRSKSRRSRSAERAK